MGEFLFLKKFKILYMKKLNFLSAALLFVAFMITSCNNSDNSHTMADHEENIAATESEETPKAVEKEKGVILSEEAKVFLGTWNYVVKNVPNQGDVEGYLIFKNDENGASASIGSDDGSMDMTNFKMDEKGFKGNFTSPEGFDMKLEGSFDKDAFTGKMTVVSMPNFVFDVSGERD